jgi:hypothetical protein
MQLSRPVHQRDEVRYDEAANISRPERHIGVGRGRHVECSRNTAQPDFLRVDFDSTIVSAARHLDTDLNTPHVAPPPVATFAHISYRLDPTTNSKRQSDERQRTNSGYDSDLLRLDV